MTAHPGDIVGPQRGLRRHHPVEAEAKEGRYGLMAEFTSEEGLLEAVRAARAAGYTRMDAYTPYPVEGLADLVAPAVHLGRRRDRAELMAALRHRDLRGVGNWLARFNLIAVLTLLAGISGAVVGYGLQLFGMAAWYPYMNIGGRPYNSWPYYLPITYELTILFASLTALIGMILLNGLPRPYHPVFNVPEFARATMDRFFLVIQADDPAFNADEPAATLEETARSTRQFLESLAPGRVYDTAY